MKIISTDKAPQAIGPYVQARIANGFLFASGQVPLDPVTGEVVGATIEVQTQQVLKNIEAILTAAGITPDEIVKTTCFLKNMDDFVPFNNTYSTLGPFTKGCIGGSRDHCCGGTIKESMGRSYICAVPFLLRMDFILDDAKIKLKMVFM